MRMPYKDLHTKVNDTRKKTTASMWLSTGPCVAVNCTASSTASNPNKVVNLMIGFMATEDVSLNGSPTVSPITVASCSAVPFCFSSTSTIFLALSQAAPALAMNMAWYKPNAAMEMRYPMKKNGSMNAKDRVTKNTAMKMLNMPFWAYLVQISTTFLLSPTEALSDPSSLMLALMNSTAR